MINFLKHLFKSHYPYAAGILVLIVFISAMPNQDILSIKKTAAEKIIAFGKTTFRGTGADYLTLKGQYNGDKNDVFKIVINEEMHGVKSFKLSKNNGPYAVHLLTDKEYELSGGTSIKFDPKLAYHSGDSWTINLGASPYFNAISVIDTQAGQKIANAYSNFSSKANIIAMNISRVFIPSSGLKLKIDKENLTTQAGNSYK